jgi:hypothetical protein
MLELPVVVNEPDVLPALEVQTKRARVEKGRPVEDPPMAEFPLAARPGNGREYSGTRALHMKVHLVEIANAKPRATL